MPDPLTTPSAPRPHAADLGLGTAALGRPEYLNLDHGRDLASGDLGDGGGARYDRHRLEQHAHEVLDAAWTQGVRHLDAARSYGAAEAFVGSWLAAHPGRREQLRIGSKWGYTYVADFRPGATEHETKDHSEQTLARQWPETLAALGSPPDLYLVHSLTSDSPALDDARLLDRLRGLAADGVRVGLSTSGPDQGEVLVRALALDRTPFSTVQATWNLLEPSAGPALLRAHEAGWSVVVKEAMANGRLAAADGPLAAAARGLGTTPDALALAAATRQPWADVVLSGASALAQLRSNLAARALVDDHGEATGAVLDDLAGPGGPAEPAAAYWATRKRLPWT
ncbi:aldo/keto reductase [Nocardioides scoriae]|uniref:aldo/keto reductase n=1 Tax=Nocardioides scoriae TaxID=642780 RepID=UPI001E4F6D9D|nr:aldo/keto reductase [Nocardioides scoriae]